MIRRELRFVGRVQGVGFRATARKIAEAHELGGWVRNEPDGAVRLVVEGPGGAVDALLAELRAEMDGLIASIEVEERQPTGEFARFEIRR
ncbi:MAG TPA: acylphosphatase [Phycisphaerales bacterium]|nr:acylphosphatase [Phycisphaerales bacterium]HMP36586.1 acylphosphatase [Phycisphaerales bacterium]